MSSKSLSSPQGREWSLFFTNDDTDDTVWSCNLCPRGSKTYRQQRNRGYTNLMSHVKGQHQDSIDEVINQHRNCDKVNTLQNYANLTGTRKTPWGGTIHDWLVYCIFLDHPFSYVDKKLVKDFAKMQSISSIVCA